MGKVKVVSKGNPLDIRVRNASGEVFNSDMAEKTKAAVAAGGFLPFSVTPDNWGFEIEYRAMGMVSAKEYFKNQVVDRGAFYTFMDSSVRTLSGMAAYGMEYSNVLVDIETVAVDVVSGQAFYMYYPVSGYSNGKYFNVFLSDILKIMKMPKDEDLSYIGRLNDMIRHPKNMSWDTLRGYVDSIYPSLQKPSNPIVQVAMPRPQMGSYTTQPILPQGQPGMQQPNIQMAAMQETKPPVYEGKICLVCGKMSKVDDAKFCPECGAKLYDKIIIKGGRVVDPVTGKDELADVLINDGIIEDVGQDIAAEDAGVIDASGLVVAPGLVDTHVHFRDPGFTYKEDIISGAAAAAKGGFTTVVCMANTNPAVDNIQTLEYIRRKGETTGIHVVQTANVTMGMRGAELVDMKALADAGAAGFTDDGIPVMDENVLVRAMETAAQLGLPISLHEEDPAFIVRAGVNKGEVSEKIGYGGASRTAEDVMVARDCMLALHTGASVCIQHISSGNSVELVRTAKKLGADVHAEATPHHFTLTEDAVLQYGANAKMNPPLRTEDDRQRIIEGIKDGTIDMIVTDHAPHSEEEKARPLESAPSGITGLETSLGLGIRSLVMPGHITLLKLMELMSKNPAEFYRMTPGSIAKGAAADIVIFGEKELWTVKKEEFASKASNSPFIGWKLPGKVHYTICSGKVVYRAQ